MKCDELQKYIFPLIGKEISGEKRIIALDHIRQCSSCREKYIKFLKQSYQTKIEIIKPIPERITIGFSDQVISRLVSVKKRKSYNSKWILAAAAIIIIAISVVLLQINSSVPDGTNTFAEMIKNEDWHDLYRGIKNKNLANEKIPIEIIITKLENLESRGIRKIDLNIIEIISDSKSIEFLSPLKMSNKINATKPENRITTRECIVLINQLGMLKKDTTLREIFDFYNTIIKKGMNYET